MTVENRDVTAARLLKSSAKNSYDPYVDVDWDAPLAEGKPDAAALQITSGRRLWKNMWKNC